MSQRPWPRDPRDAGRGSFSLATHYMPVTLFLIFVSAVVFALTGLDGLRGREGRGDRMAKVDMLYFSSQSRRVDYLTTYDEYETLWKALEAREVEGKPLTRDDEQRLESLEGRLQKFQSDIENPLADVKKGQVWRLVTPIFLHFGIMHIVFNMMWLWQLGSLLEIRFRSMKFLGLILFVAVVSNVSQALWHDSRFGGMSGVVYGLFGFVWLRGKLHPSPEFALSGQTISGMLVWMVVCFTGLVGPIANAAHVMGLVAGGAAGTANALMAGGWGVLKRRRQFRSAMSSSANSLHRCVVCGKTEHSDPSLEFYVDGDDHQEYCRNHLPQRE